MCIIRNGDLIPFAGNRTRGMVNISAVCGKEVINYSQE